MPLNKSGIFKTSYQLQQRLTKIKIRSMDKDSEINQEELDKLTSEFVKGFMQDGFFDEEGFMQKTPPSDSTAESANDVLHSSITRMLAKQFSSLNDELIEEAENLFSIDKVEQVLEPTERQCKAYLENSNPYIRHRIASLGYFPDVLKHDSVAEVRLAVLNKTGIYSEFFREQEHDIDVIREMLRKGYELEYFKRSEDPDIQQAVRHSEQYHFILSQICRFEPDTVDILRLVVDSLESLYLQNNSEREFRDIEGALKYLRTSYFNQLDNFDVVAQPE